MTLEYANPQDDERRAGNLLVRESPKTLLTNQLRAAESIALILYALGYVVSLPQAQGGAVD